MIKLAICAAIKLLISKKKMKKCYYKQTGYKRIVGNINNTNKINVR